MKRALTTTTALSLVFSPMAGLPLFAQTAISVGDQTVQCVADAQSCPEGTICIVTPEGQCETDDAMAQAVAAVEQANAAAVEAAAAAEAAEAARLAEEEAAKAAEAAAAAEQAAAEQAAKLAEEETAKAAEAEAARQAEEEAAKAAEAASAEAARLAEEEAAKAAEAATAAEAEAARLAEEEAAKAAEAEAAAKAAAEAQVTPAPEATTAEPAPEVAAEPAVTPEPVVTPEPEVATTPEAAPETPAPETVVETAPVEAPVVTEEASESLLQLLTGAATEGDAPVAAAAAAAATGDQPAADAAAPQETVTEITEADTRSSAQEFAAAPTAVGNGKKSGLSDLEKVGLVALGALVVGAILNNGDEVVSNSGDRVVVKGDDGEFRVLKDDDTLLRRPGSTVRTETFSDGSTRSTLSRDDGSVITTIRDASGRVLRRSRLAADGRETLLIDDLTPVERIEVSTLPKPRPGLVISASDGQGSLETALRQIETRENARYYSLRQIREYREVRALAPTIDVENIRFRSGSSAIDATEAEKLSVLGRLIADVIRDRPYELFLIEGHTDAVGSAGSNLALSDRRAESVALALTEYFGVPPENLVVQGYGESELRIPTQADEPLNRRAAVRLISPLMQTAGLR